MTIFSSRDVEDLKGDELPMVGVDTSTRYGIPFSWHEVGEAAYFRPRHTHEANPILTAFRDDVKKYRRELGQVFAEYETTTDMGWGHSWDDSVTQDHVDHARKVLARLEAVTLLWISR